MRGRTGPRTAKRAKVPGSLLHVSSLRVSYIPSTEHVVAWKYVKRSLLVWQIFAIFWLRHAHTRQIPGSPHFSILQTMESLVVIITTFKMRCVVMRYHFCLLACKFWWEHRLQDARTEWRQGFTQHPTSPILLVRSTDMMSAATATHVYVYTILFPVVYKLICVSPLHLGLRLTCRHNFWKNR